jgi:hypothetical protein
VQVERSGGDGGGAGEQADVVGHADRAAEQQQQGVVRDV